MSIAEDLAAHLSLWDTTGDLQTYATAIGQMFVEVEGYADDTDTVVGWQPLWDVDLAPHNALPWLAMVMGERLPSGSTDAQARALIRAAPNQDRGGPTSIVSAVKQCLLGSQIVGFKERSTSDGTVDDDSISVFTYSVQTPDQNAVLAALRRTVPADIHTYYQYLTGPTWEALEEATSGGDWTTLMSTFGPTWGDVESATPGYVIFAG